MSQAVAAILLRDQPEEQMERLHVNQVRDIVYRLRQGESEREIALDLRVSRHTVAKYRELAMAAGYLDEARALPAGKELLASLGPVTPPPKTESTVAPYREVVEGLLSEGAEMTAILARLREGHGYTGSYSSIRRFVSQVCPTKPEVFIRVQTPPGEEAQVDFGSVKPLYDPVRHLTRPAFLFVMTLSFSRHQYAELVFDQRIPTWIACHRHAFEWFGGLPKRVVLDNLKAAVISASLDEPVLGEAYRRMAQHYGCLVSPNRPRTPEHKGKVESGVHYAERNFIAGSRFPDIDVANQRLRVWVVEVAGARRHGTTGQAPLKLFNEREKATLLPLPSEPFSLVDIRQVKVHRDCHVTIEGSFYSVPHAHVGEGLQAHIGERTVELYAGVELVRTHPRAKQKGEWHTCLDDYPPEKAAYLERTPERCRVIAGEIGPETTRVVGFLLGERPLDQLRAVQRLLKLEEKVGRDRLEAACRRALHFGDARYRRVRDILNAGLDQEPILPEPVPFPRLTSAESAGSGTAGNGRQYTFARRPEEFLGRGLGAGVGTAVGDDVSESTHSVVEAGR
jgi:transposase